MATSSSIQTLIQQFQKFTNYRHYTIQGLSTTDAMRSDLIYRTMANLPSSLMETLPDAVVETMTYRFRKFNDEVEPIIENSKPTPQQLGAFQSKLEELYDFVVQLTPELNRYINTYTQSLINEIQRQKKIAETAADSIEGLKKSLEEQQIKFSEREKRFDQDVEQIEKKRELIIQGLNFDEAAKKNKIASYYWIAGIIATTSALMLIVFFWLYPHCINFSCFIENITKINATSTERYNLFFYYLIKNTLIAFLVISFFIFLLKFTVKNYNASMHNLTINLHKANAFAASLNMIRHSSDNNKDQILIIAAKAIFEQQRTGYLAKDRNEINISVLEKLANIFK